MTLSDLKYGQTATVLKIQGEQRAIRLFEMGLLPGEEVELQNVALWGDPIAIRVGEYKMCLRKQDASHIEIKLK